MRSKLPPFPTDTRSAVLQIRAGTRTVARSVSAFVEISERYTYYRLGKLQSSGFQIRRTAMRRGKLRKHIQRWLERIEALLVFDVSDELYRSVRLLAVCAEKVLRHCERIPRKSQWHGDPWCERLSVVASEIGRSVV